VALPLAFNILTKYDDKGLKQAGKDFDAFGRKSKVFGKNIGDNIRKGVDAHRLGGFVGKNIGSGMRVGIGGPLKGIAGLMAGAFAAVSAVKVFGTFITEARESAKIGRITAQVIKSTGGAANITAVQVGKLADTLSNKTAIDDEQVQAASNLLLTFKNVRNEVGKGNDIFNRATEAALDLSAAGFGSVESASKMLGKALNDPLKGLTALGRAGVTFTDSQKKQIKTLVESGNVLAAQKIIMQEVAFQVGGAAKAAADPIQRLKVIALNLAERVGTVLLPIVEKAANWLGTFLPKALDKAEAGFRRIRPAVQFVTDVLGGFFGRSKDVQTAAGRLDEAKKRLAALQDQAAKGIGTKGLTKKETLVQAEDGSWVPLSFYGGKAPKGVVTKTVTRTVSKTEFAKQLEQAQREVEQAGKDLVAVEGKATKSFGQKIGEQVGKIGRTLVEKAKVWGGDLAKVAKGWGVNIIAGVRTGIDTGDWSGLGKSIGSGIAGAIESAGSFIGKIAVKIGDLLGKVDWLGLGIKVGKLAVPFLVGIALGLLNFDLFGLIKGLASHWQEALFAVLAIAFTPGKVIGAVARLFAKIPLVGPLLAWALLAFKKFANGLVGMVGRALGFLGKAFLEGFRRVFPGIGKRFAEELSILPTRLGLIALEIRARALKMMQGLATAIASRIGAVVARIGELIAKMLKPFARAAGWLIGRGVQFVAGLVRGINGVLGTVVRIAARVISVLTLPFRTAVSWLVGRGVQTVSGLVRGVGSMLGSAARIAGRVISTVTSPFRTAGRWLVQAGRNIVHGLADGIGAVGRGLGGFVNARVVAPIMNVVRGFLKFINNHIIGNVNRFARPFTGGKNLVDEIPIKFARGGKVPGQGVGDRVPALLEPGEFVIRKKKAQQFGYDFMEDLNRGAQRFAVGGRVYPVGRAPVTQGYSSGHPAVDWGVPVGTPVRAAMAGVVSSIRSMRDSYGKHIRMSHDGYNTLYAHLNGFLAKIGQRLDAGNRIGWSGNTGNTTGPHLHFEVTTGRGASVNPLSWLSGAGTVSNAGRLGQFIRSAVAGAAGLVLGPLKRLLAKTIGTGGFRGVLSGMGGKAINQVLEWLRGQDAKTNAANAISFAGSPDAAAMSRGGAVALGRQMAAARGWTGAQWQALYALWQGESGWNPRADNPTSTAWGIPQFLASTARAYGIGAREPDAGRQIWAGLRYISDRYGNPGNAYGAWRNRSPHWYDKGGVARGQGDIPKRTPEPERVLSPRQTGAFERLVSVLDRGRALTVAQVSNVAERAQTRDPLGWLGRLRKTRRAWVYGLWRNWSVPEAIRAWSRIADVRFLGGRGPLRSQVTVEVVNKPAAGWVGITNGSQVALNSGKRLSGRHRRMAAMHELGHVLGLNHTGRRDSIMYPRYQGFSYPTGFDQANLRRLYPKRRKAPPRPATRVRPAAPRRLSAWQISNLEPDSKRFAYARTHGLPGAPRGFKWVEDYTLVRSSFQRGTPFVPRTGMYQLHRGEAVIPAHKNRGGTGATVHHHYHFDNYVGDKNDLVRALEDLRRQRRLPKAG
jgi:hypothetical protein